MQFTVTSDSQSCKYAFILTTPYSTEAPWTWKNVGLFIVISEADLCMLSNRFQWFWYIFDRRQPRNLTLFHSKTSYLSFTLYVKASIYDLQFYYWYFLVYHSTVSVLTGSCWISVLLATADSYLSGCVCALCYVFGKNRPKIYTHNFTTTTHAR